MDIYEQVSAKKLKEIQNNENILFYIHKNTNKNVVIYELKDSEIDVYWMGLEPALIKKKGAIRYELGTMERRLAYGVKNDGKYLKLVSVDKAFEIVDKKVITEISGVRSYVSDVYTHIEGTYLRFPKVKYIIINGFSVSNGIKTKQIILSTLKEKSEKK